ncbi:MAG: histidine kinase [Microbacterium sp.]
MNPPVTPHDLRTQRRPSGLWRAFVTSLACVTLGGLAFVLNFGQIDTAHGDAGIDKLNLVLLLDLGVGLIAAIAAGPVRRSTGGNALLVVAGAVSTFALPAFAVALVRFGERRSWRLDAALIAFVAVAGTGVGAWHSRLLGEPAAIWETAIVVGVLAFALILWGRSRGTRAALVAALRRQAEQAENARVALAQSRDSDLARARAEERSALARDMHDGISHQLSVIAMHAGALSSRDDLTAEQVDAAAHTVREAAAEAGRMLRESLTVLRGPSASSAPLPTADSVDRLVARARDRGVPASVTWDGVAAADLVSHPTITVALARIVDELLVNAAKHAPGSPTTISVARDGDDLVLRARNPLSTVGPEGAFGAGHGLLGVAERAALLGGSACCGPTDDGHFAVEVRLPWAR